MMQPDDLLSLKDDMIAFIEGHGMRRLPGYVGDDVPTVMWEDDANPDSWKDFVETAKAARNPHPVCRDGQPSSAYRKSAIHAPAMHSGLGSPSAKIPNRLVLPGADRNSARA